MPGVTAAFAAAAALGVSLTHRDFAHSVRFVTGHARDGSLPADLDWRGLADATTTLVFYMGWLTAPAIAERLLASGLPAATPVVVATRVSRADQSMQAGTLTDLAAGTIAFDRAQPVLIGIGGAFASAAKITSSALATDAPAAAHLA